MEKQLQFTDEQRAEIKAIVHEALVEFFSNVGKGTKFWIVTAATIVGALLVLIGGLKWVLGILGFTYLSK